MKSTTAALAKNRRSHFDRLAEFETICAPVEHDNTALPPGWEPECIIETFMANRACLRITDLEPFVSLDRFDCDDEGLYGIEEADLACDDGIPSLVTLLH